MYHRIDEPIEVIGIYHQHTFVPKKFRWRKKEFLISQITLKSDVKDGGVRKRLYSVTVGRDVYRLEFNRENEAWKLEEVWVEG